jgi:HPt (histidine-containing phosphotransfer) domain-containing protein
MLDMQQFDLEKVVKGLEAHVTEFYETRQKEFDALKEHLSNSDFPAASAITHNWKGFCAPYGFGYLGQLAIELELSLKNKDLVVSQEKIKKIEDYFKAKKIRLNNTKNGEENLPRV